MKIISKNINVFVFLFLFSIFIPSKLIAQDIQAISAIVNDEVISRYDVQQRVQLIVSTSGIKPTQENINRLETQALRSLVNEKIQLQEAIKLDVPSSDDEVNLMLERIANGNQMSGQEILQQINSQGVKAETLLNQIKAELLWNKIVRGRYGSYINVNEDEVSIVYDRTMESIGKDQYDISEIFISYENEQEEQEANILANRLVEQLRSGATFSAVAQQFSQTASSGQGGYIGWVTEGQLDDEIIDSLRKLQKDEISNPINTVAGFFIIKLNDKTKAGGKNPLRNQYDLVSVIFEKDQKMEAESFSKDFVSCKRIDKLTDKYNEKEVNYIGKRILSDLPENLRDELLNKEAGDTLSPRIIGENINVILICDRKDDIGLQISREAIEENIYAQKIGMMSRRYLRDLRRDAVIEYR
ncbi:MAG: peptidylprolyl isomerase [Pseudomonadota bacterium]|nr:peptidylprolyl isomerase [Pseudomonadota bacterium]MEC7830616.1 peptidylprolyl isomerase [Pseudomonadota bacterium]MEC9382584.1 peptidylprolyl isomerase [Pseudomonadota bacterium]MEC9481340.1 peptidylprolyl isomerase [Pseudomonadota bacterium]